MREAWLELAIGALGVGCAIAAVFLALSGCGATVLPPNSEYDRDTATANQLALWEREHGRLQRCRDELHLLRWEFASVEVTSARCVTALPLAGCFAYSRGEPVITVSTAPKTHAQMDQLRAHELSHWLLQCSEMDPSGDPLHERPFWRERGLL